MKIDSKTKRSATTVKTSGTKKVSELWKAIERNQGMLEIKDMRAVMR